MKRFSKVLFVVVGAFALLTLATSAWAYWTSHGTGSASASVATIEAPVASSSSTGAGIAHVSWTSAVMNPSGPAVTNYYVQRYAGTSVSGSPTNVCSSSPASPITGNSCDDSGLTTGDYTYVVTAVFNSWTATSNSTSVFVQSDSVPPTVDITSITNDAIYSSSGTIYAAGPSAESAWPASDLISGTAGDTGGSGLSGVAVSIKQVSTGKWWSGTGNTFDQTSELYLPATGSASWSLHAPISTFPAGGDYEVHARAIDGANNQTVDNTPIHIDYDAAKTIFVNSAAVNDTNDGTTPALADKTIAGALTDASAGRNLIVISGGSYPSTVNVSSVFSGAIRGGYSSSSWLRSAPGTNTVTITGDTGANATGVIVNGTSVRLQQLSINSGTTTTSAYGIRAINNASVVVEHSPVVAGNGAAGADGTTPAGQGTSGAAGTDGPILNNTTSAAGGSGSGAGLIGGTGGKGGGAFQNGSAGSNGNVSGSGGGTGGAGTTAQFSGSTAGGGHGTQGAPGGTGTGGAGGSVATSQYTTTLFTPGTGSAGNQGLPGSGGGGGGGTGSCLCTGTTGSGGGGGGQGGTGGIGGTGGTGGGGSFAAYSANSTITFDSAATLTTGNGGKGGEGSSGQAGGLGGAGGDGGAGNQGAAAGAGGTPPGDGTNGANGGGQGGGGGGGSGGTGGTGGPGGGGSGGPSIASVKVGTGGVTVPNPATQITTGNPGIGGGAGVSQGATGTSGGQLDSSDSTAPGVTVATVNGSAVTFPYFTTASVTSVGGACGQVLGDGPTVNVTVTGAGSASQTVNCNAGAWTMAVGPFSTQGAYVVTATQNDTAGNVGTSAKTITIDTTAPVVTLTKENNNTVTFPFLTNASITSVGGACTNASGDSPTVSVVVTGAVTTSGTPTCTSGAWAFSFTGSVDGSYSLTASQSDAAGNSGNSGAAKVVTVDRTAPTVTINQSATQADPTNASPINFTVVFSEPVTGFATGDVTFGGSGTGGTKVGTVTGSGTTYNVAVTGQTGNGTITATIAANKGTDLAGNGNAASTSTDNSVALDTAAPTLTSINRAGTTPTKTGPLTWTVTFSEPVSGVTASNFGLANSNLGGTAPTISSVTATTGPPSATWTVTLSTVGTTGLNNGSIGLNWANSTNVKDAANNTMANTTFTGQAYNYDTTAPTITSINRVGANPTNTGPLTFAATFSEPVNGVTSSNFALVTSGITGTAPTIASAVASPSAPSATWNVTVATAGAVGSNSGSIQLNWANSTGVSDAVTNAMASATLPGQAFTYDTTAPAAPSVPDLASTSDTGSSNSDNITNDQTPTFSGTAEANATVTLFAGATQVGTGTATSGAWTITTTTLAANTYSITAVATDAAGNASVAGPALSVQIDITGPALSTATSGGGTAGRMESGDTITLVFGEALDPTTVPATATVAEARSGGGGGSSTLTIAGIIQGSVGISNTYVSSNNSTVSSTATVVLSNGNKTITLTLGAVTGSALATGTGSATVAPATSIKDLAGNAPSGSQTITRLF